MAEWNVDEALASLADETLLMDEGDSRATVKRIFREAGPAAAAAVVHVAKFSTNEKNRLQAAQYVVERNIGKIGDDDLEDDPLAALLGNVVKEEEDNIVHARAMLQTEEGDNSDGN
jgi:hypothetical protein